MQNPRNLPHLLLTLLGAMVLSMSASASSDRNPLAESYSIVGCDTLDIAIIDAERNPADRAASPLQIIDNKSIERRGVTQVHEVVKTLAGISIKDYGGIGGLKTVSVRNLGAQHTAISYDGFTISDAQNGQVDISMFMLENIKELSVGIGPSDNIFRAARLLGSSGSVNIVTKEVTQDFEARAGISASCFGTWNPHLHLGGRIGKKGSLSADANYLRSIGNYPFILQNGIASNLEKRLNSDVQCLNTELNFQTSTIKNQGKFSLKTSYNQSQRGLPGPVILYNQNPKERLWDNKFAMYAKYNWHWGLGWKTEIASSYIRNSNKYINENPSLPKLEKNQYLQQEGYISTIFSYTTGNWKFAGAEDIFTNILESDIPECPFPIRLNSMTALSAQYNGNRVKITGTLIGRYIKEWLRGKTILNSLTGVNSAPKPLFRLSPALSLTYSITRNRNMIVRFSIKDGYRVPTFNDLYYSRIGNTSLVPEKALITNLGIIWTYRHNKIVGKVSIDGYYNHVTDKITAIPTMFIWRMRNIGQVSMTGIDASTSVGLKISNEIYIHTDANYSFQHAIDITNPESKAWKQQIPYTPKHSGNIIISAETHWLTATYTLTTCGKRYSLPQNIRQNLIEAYTDHSISIGRTFKISPISMKINIEAQNISNKNYEIIKGYPMPGRSFRISMKLNY